MTHRSRAIRVSSLALTPFPTWNFTVSIQLQTNSVQWKRNKAWLYNIVTPISWNCFFSSFPTPPIWKHHYIQFGVSSCSTKLLYLYTSNYGLHVHLLLFAFDFKHFSMWFTAFETFCIQSKHFALNCRRFALNWKYVCIQIEIACI